MAINYSNPETLSISDVNSNTAIDHEYVIRKKVIYISYFDSDNLLNKLNDYQVIKFDSYPSAAYYLQHIHGSIKIPEVIVGSYEVVNFDQISDFARFLRISDTLRDIPFILIDKDNDLNSSLKQKPIPGLDDIVKNDISIEEFLKKISLLKKFKALKINELRNSKYQKKEIPADRRFIYKIDSFFRRAMDILISSFALLILLPLLILIAIIIKLDSKGPIFYTSYRAGSNYRIFKFVKFRTMVNEADNKLTNLMDRNQYISKEKENYVFFKISNDPRITRFGKFLRNSSLDELPQLFNVLKADMSLVGNRPLPLYEAKVLTTDRHVERFNAPAGITGLWQISKRGQKDMSVEERIALDINYARHNSFANDLQIILKTPKALIQKDNV